MTGCKDRIGANKPNIVIILADDLGYGDLSCYGATKVITPNIDRLANEGRLFTDAHSPASVCTPTRYNLLTGRYCWRTWAKSSAIWSNDPLLIEVDRMTVASLLQSQGYNTACIGKWHLGFGSPHTLGWSDTLGPDYNRELFPGPNEVGFEYFYGIPHVGQKPHIYIENHKVVGLDPNNPLKMIADTRPGREKDYLHRPRNSGPSDLQVIGGGNAFYDHADLGIQLTEKAKSWIEKQSNDVPFFLYFAHRNVHMPHIPNKLFQGKSQIGPYGDFILELDWSVGEILSALDENGFGENTLIIFTSDNGAVGEIGATTVDINGHKANGILRGQKTEVFEGGHRVPFIARWPGKIESGSQSNKLIALTDLLATMAEFFDVLLPEDAGEDSYSFLSALIDSKSTQIERKAIVSDSYRGHFSLRIGNWKLILSQTGGGRGTADIPYDPDIPDGFLFDLTRDLSERKNLYMSNPEIVDSLTQLLYVYIEEGRSAPVDRDQYEILTLLDKKCHMDALFGNTVNSN